jgi:hypothetical protein
MTQSTIPTTRNAIVVTIPRSAQLCEDIKDAASAAWNIADLDFLNRTELVLAQARGSIVGVYTLEAWYNTKDVTYLRKHMAPGVSLIGFILSEAPPAIKADYLGRRVSEFVQGVKYIRTPEAVAA